MGAADALAYFDFLEGNVPLLFDDIDDGSDISLSGDEGVVENSSGDYSKEYSGNNEVDGNKGNDDHQEVVVGAVHGGRGGHDAGDVEDTGARSGQRCWKRSWLRSGSRKCSG